ncbi:MAG: DUF456 domain-containing protein [Candidatus Goldiibacteriota bacterium]
MDITLLIISILFIITALIGCFIPVLPAPALSFFGILILHFSNFGHFSLVTLIAFALLAGAASVLDNIFTIVGAKIFGGTKRAITGAIIGLIIGLIFFPPFGVITGAFLGALIGELSTGKKFFLSLKSSFGTFIGFMAGIIVRIAVTFVIVFYYILAVAADFKETPPPVI